MTPLVIDVALQEETVALNRLCLYFRVDWATSLRRFGNRRYLRLRTALYGGGIDWQVVGAYPTRSDAPQNYLYTLEHGQLRRLFR